MKKTITTLIALASFMSFAAAQDAPTKKKKVKKIAYTVDDLKTYDADKDGKLSADEYQAFADATLKAELEKYDTDKDGELSDEEKEALIAAKKAAKAKYDTDKDGAISREEREAMELELYDYNGDGAIDDAEKAIFKKDKSKKKKANKNKKKKEDPAE